MNNCCIDLKLDIYPLRKSLDNLPTISHQKINPLEHLSEELVSFFDSLGVYPSHVEIFSNYPTKIHVDMAQKDFPKINWVIGGSDSYVEWYRMKNESVGNQVTTTVDTTALRYNQSDVESVIHRHYPSKYPCLFQAGIPHKSYLGINQRRCLSVVIRDKITNLNLTWSKMTSLFSNYI